MYEQLKQILTDAENIVFFGGAGVSTGSGIPDFRGSEGLYTGQKETKDTPEDILSSHYLHRYPERFFQYYKTHMLYPNAQPNEAHYALAELERMGKLSAVITQNIDGLHQAAGSQNVIELHGSVARNYCMRCGKRYPLSHVLSAHGVPRCTACDGVVRPDVVLYGEGLDGDAWARAEEAVASADVLIVGGTSLTVHPAASLVTLFEGSYFIIINRSPTPCDGYADLVIREPIEEVLSCICE